MSEFPPERDDYAPRTRAPQPAQDEQRPAAARPARTAGPGRRRAAREGSEDQHPANPGRHSASGTWEAPNPPEATRVQRPVTGRRRAAEPENHQEPPPARPTPGQGGRRRRAEPVDNPARPDLAGERTEFSAPPRPSGSTGSTGFSAPIASGPLSSATEHAWPQTAPNDAPNGTRRERRPAGPAGGTPPAAPRRPGERPADAPDGRRARRPQPPTRPGPPPTYPPAAAPRGPETSQDWPRPDDRPPPAAPNLGGVLPLPDAPMGRPTSDGPRSADLAGQLPVAPRSTPRAEPPFAAPIDDDVESSAGSLLGARLDGALDADGPNRSRPSMAPIPGMPPRQAPGGAGRGPMQTRGMQAPGPDPESMQTELLPAASASHAPNRAGQPAPEAATELIAPVEDDYDDEYADDYDDGYDDGYDEADDDSEHAAAAEGKPRTKKKSVATKKKKKDSAGRILARSGGELMLTAGFVVLLFVFYELFVTGWFTSSRQAQADSRMEEMWQAGANERDSGIAPMDGDAFARIYVPKFGSDYRYSIVEGTSDENLEVGPGHYIDSALPGERGNFAVAGHRVGWGSPFNNLDLLESCDAIVIEGQSEWFVYRVLPMESEIADWEATRAARPECTDVPSLVDPNVEGGGAYGMTPGQQIVSPSQGEVILPVPSNPGVELAEADQRSLITLTTCHPRFSAEQRMIIHGLLTAQYPKEGEGAGLPPELESVTLERE
ncbi:class E sortase [Actinoalloteichus hymeniacidonis]|uniref:class E sortase n=1 Tax=Actinoalloteichus hymeniacidonis TaxID=340345 RepID=UPI0017F2A7EE|nr:class E sortase [Actinoalloteichus hymeniacidonis]MBB5911131.1 LPXTG-site transpeptidase (sortase) family protein [Actinoalloteichus hymeniacidonis]